MHLRERLYTLIFCLIMAVVIAINRVNFFILEMLFMVVGLSFCLCAPVLFCATSDNMIILGTLCLGFPGKKNQGID